MTGIMQSIRIKSYLRFEDASTASFPFAARSGFMPNFWSTAVRIARLVRSSSTTRIAFFEASEIASFKLTDLKEFWREVEGFSVLMRIDGRIGRLTMVSIALELMESEVAVSNIS